jgi:hypothetical protein
VRRGPRVGERTEAAEAVGAVDLVEVDRGQTEAVE